MRNNKYRFGYMILVGILISFMFKIILFRAETNHSYLYDLLLTIGITVFIWEGNLQIDHYLHQKLPWIHHPLKRLIIQLLLGLSYSMLILFMGMFGFHHLVCGNNPALMPQIKNTYLSSVFITVALLSAEIGYQFFKNWKLSLLEIEKYKTESVQAQLQNLKNQLNPHFLFNNLSVLNTLVKTDPNKATDFIQQLSLVYRYVLDNKSAELVTLEEEMKFVEHYIYLLKIRFDQGLRFDININSELVRAWILPLCIQMLVENAIKHNEASQAFPLHISIETKDQYLWVSNPIRPRLTAEYSTQSGRKNMEARYAFYTDLPIQYDINEQHYAVGLPLIFNI